MIIVLALLACAKPDAADTAQAPDTGLTYYADVAPVIERACTRCHFDGGVAPVSFSDPANVVALAPLIAQYTRDGYMPPPAPDPACADYVDSERMWLTEEEKVLLADWAEAGAPLGDEADALAPLGSWTTAPFDAELQGVSAYTPDFSRGDNAYWCWPVEIGNTETAFITGTEAIVDFIPEVHHVVLFRDSSGNELPADGRGCNGLGESGWEYVTGWGPGATAMTFPDGMGLRVEPADRWILQVHYFEGTSVGPDQTAMGLHLAESVETEVYVAPLGPTGFTIPAGEPDHTAQDRVRWTGPDFHILAIWPHMHVLGSGFDMYINRDDGSETCVLDQQGWDFHSQATIRLREEIVLSDGDTLMVRCHWDNTEENPAQHTHPPEDVSFGEETENEMCFAFTYGYVR